MERARLLDGGCGMGFLLDILDGLDVDYTGVDICRATLDYAIDHHSTGKFVRADLRKMPFESDSFDLVVLRSIEGEVLRELGSQYWADIKREVARVCSGRVLLLNYTSWRSYKLLTKKEILL